MKLWPSKKDRVRLLFEAAGSSKLSGAQISSITGMWTGSLYPYLFRLEKAGVLESGWGEPLPSGLRRRLYWLRHDRWGLWPLEQDQTAQNALTRSVE